VKWRAWLKEHVHAPKAGKKWHKLHTVTHLGYFAAVWAEAHGIYGMFGGALFVLGVVGLFLHAGEEA